MTFASLTTRWCGQCLPFLKVLFVAGVFVMVSLHTIPKTQAQAQVSCSSEIVDTLTGTPPRGADQNLHDEDDKVESSFQDGFDEQTPSPTVDFNDNKFSHTARLGGGLFGAGFEPSGVNILVDDPDAALDSGSDGSGYVDLLEFDLTGNSYAGVFDVQVTCDTNNGYDLHIADTFNMDPTSKKVGYDTHDIAIFGQVPKTNLNKREGLFRIAPGSLRDITDFDLISGFETQTIKHEYIMDLPNEEDCGTMTVDDYDGDCAPASLDPFATFATERLRTWPYAASTPPNDDDFGIIGFTLLCDENGDTGAATAGTGKINPFTRGLLNPGTGENHRFREDGPNDDDCDDPPTSPEEYYAAMPSLINVGDYDGIAGTDPSTYSAILSADNWVGYSGVITGNPPFTVDNYFELRAQVPNNQIAGTYAGTMILSCLPNMTANNEADFDGDGIGDETVVPEINFQTASDSNSEDITPLYVPVTLSVAQGVSISVDFAFTGGTVTFSPFTTTVYIPTDSITIVDDLDPETDETIEITLSNPTSPAVLGGVTVYTYTIVDNDSGGGGDCLGPGFNWTSGFNFSCDFTIPSAGGTHSITFTTDFFCTEDGTSITLVGADTNTLYTDSCGGGGTLSDSTTYNVGPFTDTAASPPDATLIFTDGFGDGGFTGVTWTYTP